MFVYCGFFSLLVVCGFGLVCLLVRLLFRLVVGSYGLWWFWVLCVLDFGFLVFRLNVCCGLFVMVYVVLIVLVWAFF